MPVTNRPLECAALLIGLTSACYEGPLGTGDAADDAALDPDGPMSSVDSGGDTGGDTGGEPDPDRPMTGGVPTDVTCDEDGEPRTIDCYYEQIIDNGITNVEDAIPLIPADIRGGLFLMQDSRSRHQASLEYPRIVLYGEDSDFIISMSSMPTDPLYEVMELIEFQDDGTFKFRQLDMSTDPPILSPDDSSCQGCHGPRVRMIWGQYRTWPGNYEAEAPAIDDLPQRVPERFGALDLHGSPGWSVELWNFQQNRLTMRHHAQFMKASDAYDTGMRYRIASTMCDGGGYGALEALMRELGFSAVDTRSDLLAGEVGPDEDLDWYGGGGTLSDVLQDVAVIDLLYQDGDAELEAILQPYIEALSPLYTLSQSYYDSYNGLLPFDVPISDAGNGASAPSPEGAGYDGYDYNGYGGNYGGLRLRGYLGAWATYPVPLFEGISHDPIRAAFCERVTSQL